ncbi:MAG: replicative DNA helicase [Clostridiales bacterium]|nr:replicative DNA helicase [Clostridiales bacterium]
MADDQEYLNNLIDQGAGPANGEVDAEMALLALCMRKNTAVLETVENKIAEEDFTDARNRTIYSVIIDMFLDNAQIDRITVFSELERRGLADKAGGQRYVYRVGDKTAVQSALLSYIAAVRERSDRTKLLKAVDKIRTKATDGKMKASEAVDYAINEIAHLKTTGESKGFEILSTILKSTMSEITAELRDENAGGKVKVGFPKLDAMLGGLRPGSLNILAARPSMGKSALAINMAANVAAYQNPVAIFSLEMSKQEIASRLMSSTMSKSVSDIIYSRKMKDSDKQQLDRALVKLSEYPIYIDDNSDTNPVTMKSKLQQLFSDPDPNKRPKLVVIDYLQLMTMPSAGGRSRNEEVTAISRSLKLLAKEFNIPFIALSQLSRGAAQRDDHTPQLSDLRDSGAIEQDADTVMFIDRPDYYKKKDEVGPDAGEDGRPNDANDNKEYLTAYIYLSKNRHGKTGRDTVCWIPKKTMFIEWEKDDPKDEGGSPYTRTVDGDSAAQNYNFDNVTSDEAPIPEPPMPDNDDIPPVSNDDFFAQANDDFPSGF